VKLTRCVGIACVTCFDRTFAPLLFTLQVGSFYAVRFVANMLVTVAAVLYSCESSGFYAMFLFVYLGVSVVSVNILGHRCVQDHAHTHHSRALVLLILPFFFLLDPVQSLPYSRYLTEKAEVMSAL
jgi:hypothetical protein